MHTTPLDRCTRTTPATQSPDLSCCVLALSAWPCSLESREWVCASCCVALNSCQAGCRRAFMFACVRLCTFINFCVCVRSTKMLILDCATAWFVVSRHALSVTSLHRPRNSTCVASPAHSHRVRLRTFGIEITMPRTTDFAVIR